MHELLHLLVLIRGTSASFRVSVSCAGEGRSQEGNETSRKQEGESRAMELKGQEEDGVLWD